MRVVELFARSKWVGAVRGLLATTLATSLLFVGVSTIPRTSAGAQSGASAAAVNAELGIGVNLGNALEAPREGDWGMTIEAGFFALIADAGFGHVRVPIKFSEYAQATAPYTIPTGVDPRVRNADNLWERIDWVIAQAEANDLYVVIDLHHYDEIHADVAGHRDRFLAIWDQIANRYSAAGPLVLFELLNEPHGQFNENPALLNTLLADALSVVRQSNPTRQVLVGPAGWNSIGRLDDLQLPNDPNLIVSVHYYEPFDFTHQGADWVDPTPPTGVTYDADRVGFGPGWENWSWDTTVTPVAGGVDVAYDQQWSGLLFGRPTSTIDPSAVEIQIAGQSQLSVRCAPRDSALTEVGFITTLGVGSTHVVDLTACPSNTAMVAFQVASPTFDVLRIGAAEMCTADGSCEPMIATTREVLESTLDAAQEWAAVNGRPINVGEFGAYGANGAADLAERAEWTTDIRNGIVNRGLSATYWEFGAGFGVYDRSEGAWVQPLLSALNPGGVAVTCDGRAVTINLNIVPTAVGTAGDDVILGTPGSDVIYAKAGNDVVCAGAGADTVFGGSGDDRVFGGDGDDVIAVSSGADYVSGGDGDDRIEGQGGADRLFGNGDDDVLRGLGGNDFLWGGTGSDRMYGNGGADSMWGGSGVDFLWGGNLGDRLWGEGSRDILRGDGGADLIDGGGGHDDLYGGANTDTLTGGPGTDSFDGGGAQDTCVDVGVGESVVNC